MSTQQAFLQRKLFPLSIKIVAFFLCFILSFEQTGFAQVAGQLDISNAISNAGNSFSSVFSRPAHLRYISYDRLNQSFKIILNKGDSGSSGKAEFKDSVCEPLKFFYIGLAIPNENFWVNLGPDSPDEIISDYLAKTDVGRIMLEADLELKKDLARATFPATFEGKEYWGKIYNKIEEVYGDGLSNVPVSINTRIWITPGEVVICQDEKSAYIYKARLNVSTETAYLSNKQGNKNKNEQDKIINQYSSELMQKLILPKISKEINTAKKYAALRQVYYSLILAQWFKNKFYGSGGLYPYLIDRNNLSGLTSNKQWSKEAYFKAYQKSIREKEYDLQVQVFDLFGRAVRTYSTGGVDFSGVFLGKNLTQGKVISIDSFLPPLTGQTQAADIQGGTLQDPYLSKVALAAIPLAVGQSLGAISQRPILATPNNPRKELRAEEIESIIERLKSSSRKYLQKLFNSKRINIRERVRFVADELGFDILNGQGVSLLVRNPQTLRRNKEFLEGLALPINVANLKSSKKSFVVRELLQIIKYSQWQQLTNEEKLAVVSYLFDVYGLRLSWITRDNDWSRLLTRFNLQNTLINYSLRSIDFIQQYELARFMRFGNALRTEKRMSKIKEIVEIMGLKIAELLERAETPEGFQLYIGKRRADKSEAEKLPAIETAPQDYHEAGDPEPLEELPEPENIAVTEQEAGLLKKLEVAINTSMTDLQIQSILTTLLNSNPGEDNYERIRAILRHIHPDEFKRIRRAVRTIPPFASSKLLQERFDSIVLERPSDLSVDLARSLSKIHDWEGLLKKPNLSARDVSLILEYCERIIAILSLRLNQATNDSIGSIYKIMKQSYALIQKTVIKLLEQKNLDKKLYDENVRKLLARGHYFSDYLAVLGYLADLDIAKKYLYEDQKIVNGNGYGNGNGNGNAHKKINYSFWHKMTAVPFLEKNAMQNLKKLLPQLNTEDNEFTPQEHFLNLKPTRIGSSRAWSIRKPVTVFTSVVLSLISLTLFLFATPFDFANPLFIIKGFLVVFGLSSIPLMHYIFAKIGSSQQKKDLKKSHFQIANLEKRWGNFVQITLQEIPRKTFLPSLKKFSAPVPRAKAEEDHALEGAMVTRQDVEAIAQLVGLLGIKPVELPQVDRELEKLFGPGRVSKLAVTIIPETFMLTKDARRINRPVRLGNRVFIGQQYFTGHSHDFRGFLADLAHEQMGQWIAQNRPNLNSNAHSLAEELAKVVEVTQSNAPGGIDLRRIDFVAKDMPSTIAKNIKLSAADQSCSDGAEQEIIQINRLINAKIIPSSERLKEYLIKIPVSDQKKYTKQMNNCLAEIFMLEEEYAQPSEAAFIKLLQAVALNN